MQTGGYSCITLVFNICNDHVATTDWHDTQNYLESVFNGGTELSKIRHTLTRKTF